MRREASPRADVKGCGSASFGAAKREEAVQEVTVLLSSIPFDFSL